MRKKLLTFLAIISVAVISLLSLSACGTLTDNSSTQDNSSTKAGTVILKSDNDGVIVKIGADDSGKTLFDVIESLKNDKFTFEYSESEYGAFITEVNGRKPEGNDFFSVYTSDEKNSNIAFGAPYDYNGQKLLPASFGVSGLKVVTDGIYGVCYKTFEKYELILSENDKVIINVNMVENENTTFFDVLTDLKNNGKLTFEYNDGEFGAFITEINGVKNADNSYWMFYTTDKENGSADYTMEIIGQTYYSANLGVSTLVVKPYMSYSFVYLGM